MFQNLVNLKSTPALHSDRSLPGSPQEKGGAGFGRLLSDARSALKIQKPEGQAENSVAAKAGVGIQFSDAKAAYIGMGNSDLGSADSDTILTNEKLGVSLEENTAEPALQVETVSRDNLTPETLFSDNSEPVATGVAVSEADEIEAESFEEHLDTSESTNLLNGFELAAERLAMAGSPAVQAGADVARTKSPIKIDPVVPAAVPTNDGETTNSKMGPVVSEPVNLRAGTSRQVMSSSDTVPGGTMPNRALAAESVVMPPKSSGKADGKQTVAADLRKQMPLAALQNETTTFRSGVELQNASGHQRGEVASQVRATGSNQENSAMPLPTTDAAPVKPVNDLSLGTLGQPSQTLITAIKENTNWTRMLSAPSVQFTESVKPNGKVLQALNVTLNPVELGKLELSLRMHQGQVTIEVRTATDQAYRALLVDQDSLVNNLRNLGFKVDGITISGPQSENTSQFQSTAQSEYGGAAGKSETGTSQRDNRTAEDNSQPAKDMTNVDEENTATHNII